MNAHSAIAAEKEFLMLLSSWQGRYVMRDKMKGKV